MLCRVNFVFFKLRRSITSNPTKTTSPIPEENVQNDSKTTTYPQETTVYLDKSTIYLNDTTNDITKQNDQSNDKYAWAMFAAFLGVLILICVTCVLYFFYKRSMYCLIFGFFNMLEFKKKSRSYQLRKNASYYFKE